MEQIADIDGEAELFEVGAAVSAKLSDRHVVSFPSHWSLLLLPWNLRKVPPRCK